MLCMLFCASAFNSDASGWDMSSVADNIVMLPLDASFTTNVSIWDFSKVEAMDGVFGLASTLTMIISKILVLLE